MNLNEQGNILKRFLTAAHIAYKNGNIQEGDNHLSEIIHIFTECMKHIGQERNKTADYCNETLNFGVMYNVFESNVGQLIENKTELAKTIKKVAKFINEDKNLKAQFDTYTQLDKINTPDKVVIFSTHVPYINESELKKSNRKFRSFLDENKLSFHGKMTENKRKIFETVESLIVKNSNIKHLDERMDAIETLKNLVVNEAEECDCKNKPFCLDKEHTDKIVDCVISTNNEKVNEEDAEFIKQYTTNDKEQQCENFSNLKNSIKESIEDNMSSATEEEKQNFTSILEDVTKREYKPETYVDDIILFRSIKNILI